MHASGARIAQKISHWVPNRLDDCRETGARAYSIFRDKGPREKFHFSGAQIWLFLSRSSSYNPEARVQPFYPVTHPCVCGRGGQNSYNWYCVELMVIAIYIICNIVVGEYNSRMFIGFLCKYVIFWLYWRVQFFGYKSYIISNEFKFVEFLCLGGWVQIFHNFEDNVLEIKILQKNLNLYTWRKIDKMSLFNFYHKKW